MASVLNTMMRQPGPSFCDESVIPSFLQDEKSHLRASPCSGQSRSGRGRALLREYTQTCALGTGWR